MSCSEFRDFEGNIYIDDFFHFLDRAQLVLLFDHQAVPLTLTLLKMKYIVVSGGVISGIGKGVIGQ